ncbi:MAG: FliO/MopB family protein [Candidatus Hydrogenedentes bacterium]|nr:FliO/MopB family protein [Candidatus Hydrogenedentota bacterium]
MKTGTNSAIAILLATLVAVLAFAQTPAPAQDFEAVAPPQLRLEPANLDKTTTPEAPQQSQLPAPVDSGNVTSNETADEQMQAIGREMAAGSETPPTASPEQQIQDVGTSPGTGTSTSLIRSIAALSFVLALILAIYYVLNKYGKKSPLFAGASLGTILGRVYLSPKAELHFVRIKDRVLVVGVTANGISRVAEFNATLFDETQRAELPAHVDLPAPEISPFAQELRAQSAPEPTQRAVSEEIASLRAELDKARQYFRETSGESGAL